MSNARKIKVCILSFYGDDYDAKYTIAALRLAGYLVDIENLDIRIRTLPIDIEEEELNEVIKELEEEVNFLGMSAYIWTWNKIKYISDQVSRKNNLIISIGGPEVINNDLTDWKDDVIFSYGEGEKFVREVCELIMAGESASDILARKTIANSQKNGKVYYIERDGELVYNKPVYTKKMMEKLHINDFSKEYAFYETTRGCPYRCGYCGHKFRTKTIGFNEDLLREEIKFFGEIGLKRLFVVDPIIGGTPAGGKRVLKLFNEYAPSVALTAFLRPEYLDDEFLEILSKSNIEELRLGVQTVNRNVPNWIRANDIAKILDKLPKLTQTGIPWRAELIVGLPGDDYEGLRESIRFILDEVNPTYLHAYHLTVLKETEIYRLIDDKEQWVKINPKNFRVEETYSYSKEELRYMNHYAVLLTSLYNSNVRREKGTGKYYNKTKDFKEVDSKVMKHIDEFKEHGLLHYEDGEEYWKMQDGIK